MPVKTCYWKGTGANHVGDWSWDDSGSSYTTSNWTDSAGTGIAAPAAGDTVIFRSGSQSVTAGLDQHTLTIAAMKIYGGYEGSIGSSGESLRVNVTGETSLFGGDKLYIRGTLGPV